MIEGNRIIFGYGTIAVDANDFSLDIKFMSIKPPQEIGESLKGKNVEYGKTVTIEGKRIKSLPASVESGERVVEIAGYIFDFTRFNQISLDVVKKGIIVATTPPLWFAC